MTVFPIGHLEFKMTGTVLPSLTEVYDSLIAPAARTAGFRLAERPAFTHKQRHTLLLGHNKRGNVKLTDWRGGGIQIRIDLLITFTGEADCWEAYEDFLLKLLEIMLDQQQAGRAEFFCSVNKPTYPTGERHSLADAVYELAYIFTER